MTRKFNTVPLKPRRRQLRQASTLAEKTLWQEIRGKKLGFKFLRQYSIEGYVMDFYCPKLKLGIELEGGVHSLESAKIYDKYRERYINEFGIKLLKFSNDQILNDLEKSLNIISLSLPKRGTQG